MPTIVQLQGAESKEIDFVSLIEEPEWKTILLGLVRSEKMDPWNIDIIELAEKFLEKINSLQEVDLRIPANAILASAILLRAKARLLKLKSIEDYEEQEKELQKIIEEFIPELRNPRKIREGRISLDELVMAIEKIVEKTKKKQMKFAEKGELTFNIPYSEQNIEEKIKEVYNLVKESVDSEGLVLFSALLKEGTSEEMIKIFIPLILLASDEKLNVWQEEFFGEIFISIKT